MYDNMLCQTQQLSAFLIYATEIKYLYKDIANYSLIC